jgi:hypothetical protein
VKGKNDQEPRLRLGFWLAGRAGRYTAQDAFALNRHALRLGRLTLRQVPLEDAVHDAGPSR